jgi:hypothetical protein
MNKPKRIGTAAETAVARYLQTHGFPHAERRALRGTQDAGDITGCPGVCWEVKGGDAAKNASDLLVADWLAETETERVNAGADVGVLVLQRRGVGPANAGRWWAVMLHVAVYDLRSGDDRLTQPDVWDLVDSTPLRMHLADAVRLLRATGYGQTLLDEEVA